MTRQQAAMAALGFESAGANLAATVRHQPRIERRILEFVTETRIPRRALRLRVLVPTFRAGNKMDANMTRLDPGP